MNSRPKSHHRKHRIDWQRLYDDGAVFVRLAGTGAQLHDPDDETRKLAKKPLSKWKGMDRLSLATYMSHIEQGKGIALQPSSKRWVMLDVDEGNPIDLLTLLSNLYVRKVAPRERFSCLLALRYSCWRARQWRLAHSVCSRRDPP